jgi:hypothetical protein
LEDYVRRFVGEWGEDNMTGDQRSGWETKGKGRFWILRPMLEITEGDRIVVPKQPRWDRFLILVAKAVDDDVYSFDNNARQPDNPLNDDFRHVIHTDPHNLVEFGYQANIDTLAVNALMGAYRSAVNNVWNPRFKEPLERLLDGSVTPAAIVQGPAEVVKRAALDMAVHKVLETLRTVAPHILEKIVEEIFEGQGFEVIDRNRFTGTGGDIDRVFHWRAVGHPLLERMSPDLELGVTLNIQVKQKSGIDANDVKGVMQLLAMKSGAINEYSILISTADAFTSECTTLAQKEKVILVGGKAFAELYLKFL